MPKKPAHKMSMESRAKQFAPFAALGDLSAAYGKVEREMEESLEPKFASYEELGIMPDDTPLVWETGKDNLESRKEEQ